MADAPEDRCGYSRCSGDVIIKSSNGFQDEIIINYHLFVGCQIVFPTLPGVFTFFICNHIISFFPDQHISNSFLSDVGV